MKKERVLAIRHHPGTKIWRDAKGPYGRSTRAMRKSISTKSGSQRYMGDMKDVILRKKVVDMMRKH